MPIFIRLFQITLLSALLSFGAASLAQSKTALPPAPAQPLAPAETLKSASPLAETLQETQRENALQVTYRILTHPTSQKIFRVLSDPEVKKLLDDSIRRFNFQKFLLAQLIALIVILILRSAFYPRRGFVKWILTDLWIGLVFFLIQIFIIPYALLGKTFFDLVNRMVQAW